MTEQETTKLTGLPLLLDFFTRNKWFFLIVFAIILMAALGILPSNAKEAKAWIDSILSFVKETN